MGDEMPKEDCFEIEIPFNLFQYLSTRDCNIHNLCRICLSEKNNALFPLISKDNAYLKEMFTSLTSVHVNLNDGLPSHICDLCRANVINCHEFKTQCIKADCALKSLLKGEFATKEEPKEEPKDAATETNEPKNSYEVLSETEKLKTEDDLLEDIQYLEDFSRSDNEALYIIQQYKENGNTKVDIEENETDVSSNIKNGKKKKAKKKKAKKKKEKSYACTFCCKRFNSSKAVSSHIGVAHAHGAAGRLYACAHCGESFAAERDLALHAPEHQPGPVWTCPHCHKEFNGRSSFRRHVARHMSCKRHACAACGKRFSELYALRRHARVHTGQRPDKQHQCTTCDKRYSSRSQLSVHMLSHSGARPCACSACDKTFPSARLLASHRRVHGDHKPHACHMCDKRFRHESTLRTHARTHTGERPYVCAACGKRFIQNSNLTLHMRTHTGERPYSCSTCGRSFSSGSTLKTHARTHTGDKPYQCPLCHKRFARMDLRAHMRLHTGERPYPCSVCPRRFLTAARLREHCRIHTGEKPFECATCSVKFASKSQLVKHVKTHQFKKKPTVYLNKVQPRSKQNSDANTKNERDKHSEGHTHNVHNKHNATSYMQMEPVHMRDVNNVALVETVVTEESVESKEIIVDAADDDVDVTQEIIIPDYEVSESTHAIETSKSTSSVCVRAPVYPPNVHVITASPPPAPPPPPPPPPPPRQLRLYQLDQSLVQIHSTTQHLTISKITSKMTTNML